MSDLLFGLLTGLLIGRNNDKREVINVYPCVDCGIDTLESEKFCVNCGKKFEKSVDKPKPHIVW